MLFKLVSFGVALTEKGSFRLLVRTVLGLDVASP